jgi:hypothetical protein
LKKEFIPNLNLQNTPSTNMPRTIGRASVRMGILIAAAIYYGWIIGSA